MAKIEIYTWRVCGYCMMAKRLLESRGLAYIEHAIDGDNDARAAMAQRVGGARSVPQIVIDDRPVGGCMELMALERSGELDQLLAGSPE